LAEEVVRLGLAQGLVTRQLWRTAKQEVLLGPYRQNLNRDPLSWHTIRSEFLRARESRLEERLLFLLDNLETTEGLEELLVEFPDVVGSHFGIVTSRERLHWHPGVRSVSLTGLTETDSIEFLRTDAGARNIGVVAMAEERDLKKIANALDGSPLAMKLVVGFCDYLSLETVLDWLLKAKMERQLQGGSLYTFIYLDAWTRLSETAKEVLIYIGKTAQHTVAQSEIAAVFSRFDRHRDEVYKAITELVHFCLLDPDQKSGLSDRRYGIHALTRAFVITELPKLWSDRNL
jgi:hypothetical protein